MKKQYPHFPKDVFKGAEIDVCISEKPTDGKVYTARGLIVEPTRYWEEAKAKKP